MSWLKWKKGRQDSGYDKMLLAQSMFPLPFDLWLLRYKEGAHIDWHTDPVNMGKHYRLNVVLKKAKEGGEFLTTKEPILNHALAVLFRPDKDLHKVSEIVEGTRYVLSLGWISRPQG